MTDPKLLSAEERAAQIWCEPIHSHKVMDADMAFSIAKVIREREQAAYERGKAESDQSWDSHRDKMDEICFNGGYRTGFEKAKEMAAEIFAVRSKGYEHVLEQIQSMKIPDEGK